METGFNRRLLRLLPATTSISAARGWLEGIRVVVFGGLKILRRVRPIVGGGVGVGFVVDALCRI